MFGGKVRAILWTIITVIMALYGFGGYSSGNYYMTWLGIDLSRTGFTILILVFLAIDIFSLVSAFKISKKTQEVQQQSLKEFSQNPDLEMLPAPCTINVTRKPNMVGALIPFNLYINYTKIGELKNGKTLQFTTNVKNNVLTCDSSSGPGREPFYFEAVPGGNLFIEFKSTTLKFNWVQFK